MNKEGIIVENDYISDGYNIVWFYVPFKLCSLTNILHIFEYKWTWLLNFYHKKNKLLILYTHQKFHKISNSCSTTVTSLIVVRISELKSKGQSVISSSSLALIYPP